MATTKRSSRPARRRPTDSLSTRVAPILRRTRRGTVTLADIARAAAELQVPAWATLVPGLADHRELLGEGALKGLDGLVRDYLASTPAKRTEIEACARAAAGGEQGTP